MTDFTKPRLETGCKSKTWNADLILAAWQATHAGISLVDVVRDDGGIPSKVGEICLHALDGPASAEGQPSSFATVTFDLVEYEEGTAAANVENLQRQKKTMK